MNTKERLDPRSNYRTLRELVQRALFEDILHNKYRPGDRLVETELAAAYGVSRAPVREAIRALEEQGLLRSISNKGVVVSRPSPREIREVYEIRFELESMGARLGAPNLTDEHLAQMERLASEMNEVFEEPREWLRLNNEFHLILYRASERMRLCQLIEELIHEVEPYIRLFLDVPGTVSENNADHRLLLAAARRRDGDECAAITRRHLQHASELVAVLVPEGAAQ